MFPMDRRPRRELGCVYDELALVVLGRLTVSLTVELP